MSFQFASPDVISQVSSKMDANTGCRDGVQDKPGHIRKFRGSPAADSLADIRFNLLDGSTVRAHKFVLAEASPFFEAMFCGPLDGDSNKVVLNNNGAMEVTDVDSNIFKGVIDFIYNSEPSEPEQHSEKKIDLWALLEAAHMYQLPKLAEHCNVKIAEVMKSLDDKNLESHLVRASKLSKSGGFFKSAMGAIKEKIEIILNFEVWLTFEENFIQELMQHDDIKATEGQLFMGLVKWCRANTKSEDEAVKKFQEKFASKVIKENISQEAFIKTFGMSKYFTFDVYQDMAVSVMKNKVEDLTRFEFQRRRVQNTIKFTKVTAIRPSIHLLHSIETKSTKLVLAPETKITEVFTKLNEAANASNTNVQVQVWSWGSEDGRIEKRWHRTGYLEYMIMGTLLEDLLKACGKRAVDNKELYYRTAEPNNNYYLNEIKY